MDHDDDIALRAKINEFILKVNNDEGDSVSADIRNCWNENFRDLEDNPNQVDLVKCLAELVEHTLSGEACVLEAKSYLERKNKPIYVLYDLQVLPPQYDVCTFLVQAKTLAQGRPLHVVFLPRSDGGYVIFGKYSDEEALYRLIHICVPLCILFGVTPTVMPRREAPLPLGDWLPEQKPGLKGVVDIWGKFRRLERPQSTHRSRELVKGFTDRFNKPIVTITLRSTFRNETRNSPLDVWLKVAEEIQGRYQPVFIRDTSFAFDDWNHPFPEFPVGAIDLDSRLALYEIATMNLMSSGGPMSLVTYGGLPFIGFNVRAEGSDSEKKWKESGVPLGGQPQFFLPHQRYVWERETVEIVLQQFAEIMSNFE